MLRKFLVFVLFAFLLCSCSLSAYSATKSSSMPFAYNTKDGMTIKGTLSLPKKAEKPPVVILIHSLGGSQKDWDNLPVLLNNKGFAVLTLDMRGHGQSIYNKKLQRRYWQNFDSSVFKNYPEDIILGVDNLKNYTQVDSGRIAIVGSGIGASSTAIAAASRRNVIKTIVLISPVENFKGMNIMLKLVDYGDNPILTIAGENDRIAVHTAAKIKKIAQGEYKEIIYPKAGADLLLFKNTPQVRVEIINWVSGKMSK